MKIEYDIGVDFLAVAVILHTLRTIENGWAVHQGAHGTQLEWLNGLIPWAEDPNNIFISYYSMRYNIDESRIRRKLVDKAEKKMQEVRDEIERSKKTNQSLRHFKAMYKFDEAVEAEVKEEVVEEATEEVVETPEETPAE